MKSPKISVIMASYLGNYPNAASQRDEKIVRAIESVLNQTFEDWELIVVADGCQETLDLVQPYLCPKIRAIKIARNPLFSGAPRNTGINEAKGEYITYLDIDDFIGVDHLTTICSQLDNADWVFYNDLIYNGDTFEERYCDPTKLGNCGTSNFTHKRQLGELWKKTGYAHDYHFSKELLKHQNYKQIDTPFYFVCHIPTRYDL